MTGLPRKIEIADVMRRLVEERYSRNRAELAREVSISPSALSQYVRGRATPSLEVLVALANALDVSLDYLVFGDQPVPAAAAEFGYVVSQVETGLREAQERSATLYDLVAQIGARLARQVRDVAEELLPEAATLGGTLTSGEIAELERFSSKTRTATTTLDTDVVLLRERETTDVATPGLIGRTVIENLRAGKEYEYIIPERPELIRRAHLLRQLVRRELQLHSQTALEKNLSVFVSDRGCVPGFVVYSIDMLGLERNAREIYDRVAPFFALDPENPGQASLGAVEPASGSMQNFILVASRNVTALQGEHSWMKANARRLGGRPIDVIDK